jgi:hypothetical protein
MSAEETKAGGEDVAVLPIPGARGRVEVVGTRRIFYKVRQGGEILRKRGGGWPIQLKNGSVAKLSSAGWLPGFQTLYLENERVYRFGEGVPVIAKVFSFLPLLAILANPYVGGLLGLVLVFYSLVAIKYPEFPTRVKIALPLMNTLAAVLLAVVIKGGASVN